MIILSLDPSLNCTGYSIFNNDKLIDMGYIFFRQKPLKGQNPKGLGEKLFIIEQEIFGLILKHSVDLVVMERYMQLFGGGNTSAGTAKTLPMVRGILIKTFFVCKVDCITFAPSTVKKLSTGNHKASKKEVMARMNDEYDLKLKTKKDEDISDSLAVAYTFFRICNIFNDFNFNCNTKDIYNMLNSYNNSKKTIKALTGIGVNIDRWRDL